MYAFSSLPQTLSGCTPMGDCCATLSWLLLAVFVLDFVRPGLLSRSWLGDCLVCLVPFAGYLLRSGPFAWCVCVCVLYLSTVLTIIIVVVVVVVVVLRLLSFGLSLINHPAAEQHHPA